jgi:hypothetical protein
LLVLFQAFRSGFAFTVDPLAVVADGVGGLALAISLAGVEGSFVRGASFRRLGTSRRRGSWGSLVRFLVFFWRRFVLGISFRQSLLLLLLLLWWVRYILTAQYLFLFLVLSTVDGTFESLLLWRIRLWRIRHVLAAQNLFLFLVLQALGSRWASINDRFVFSMHLDPDGH